MPALEFGLFLLIELIAVFLFILLLGYLLPCAHFYYLYFVRENQEKRQRRIQQRRPRAQDIRREIKLSLMTILIFAIMGTALIEMYKSGYTSIYRDIHRYSLAYLPISFVLCLVLFDTYFYWSHRMMHWRPIFKYFHVGHHKSISPTPWAIYAFQPLEAIVQFTGVALLVIFLPLHPTVLLAFLSFDSLVNLAGHTGHEMVPERLARHRWFAGWNTVTHHDNHHTNMRVNFGVFFNVWDRWMGTYQSAHLGESKTKDL
jgi:Delta7-sterol 5-desaturase